MSDLRKAAETALEALEKLRFANAPFLDEALKALRQALSQPEQKPVAWIKARELELMRGFLGTAQRDWRTNLGLEKWDDEDVPLYTAPPKREWVGLTDEEITSVWDNAKAFNNIYEIAQAIEAKLKEKNT